ncbi:sensor domain-containing diguanylate cyclase [Duganella sp. Leaf126]|uniref:sensor domain-containing diguanylate cyclase n=1 Tax=Duganella sp. Leaf126 TaxID=1736266 RepID=UPI00138F8F29|nr:sensor domain-containing diguanylate cyclase [Duganella sp. Leaf126]
MAILLIGYDYTQARAAFITGAMATARANATDIDKEFAAVEAALRALAASPDLMRQDLRGFYEQARGLAASQNMLNIVLEDASGKQLINTFLPRGAALPPASVGSALRVISEHEATAISGIFVGEVSHRQVASVGVPVRYSAGDWPNQGGEVGALSAAVTVERFGALLSQQSYPEHWIASILDRDGNVVARSEDMQRYVGHKALPEVIRRMREGFEGGFETATLDGKPILAVMTRAGTSGWTVGIGIPLEVLNAELNRKLWLLVLVTATLMAAGLLVAWRIGNQVSRAIGALVTPAMALGRGEPVAPASYGLREADEVGNALVDAARMHALARHQATHDPLTGLANRTMFTEFLGRQVELCARFGAPLSLLYLDLDGFKHINDTYGHAAGDQLLTGAAARLRAELRKSDLAARLGGDEFAVVLVGSDAANTDIVVGKLEASLGRPHCIEGRELAAGASIGVAIMPAASGHPGAVPSAADLVADADDAMYRRKAQRKRAAAESLQS